MFQKMIKIITWFYLILIVGLIDGLIVGLTALMSLSPTPFICRHPYLERTFLQDHIVRIHLTKNRLGRL
jgi:hypothetical protein